jgi:hypothetical protein
VRAFEHWEVSAKVAKVQGVSEVSKKKKNKISLIFNFLKIKKCFGS